MEPALANAAGFAIAARRLAAEARRRRLVVPAFRSPPRLAEADRSVRRRPDGGAVVAVRLRGRSVAAVAADMVEGVVAVNGLKGNAADEVRTTLCAALGAVVGEGASAA